MGLVQQYPALNRPPAPICSVCIANYNGAAILDDCIASVLAQRVDGEVEIIVHDDASTDDSVPLLRERYPQVELLASEENVGFCAGNNRMASHARGEYILLLNNDAALCPGALEALVSAARASARPGILTLPQYDWESGNLVDRGCLLDPFCNPIPNLDPKRHQVAYVIGACMFLPRTVWNDLGGLPEWFESIAEDMYLCGLARLRGLPVTALAASGYRHRQGATFGGNRAEEGLHTSIRRRRLSERNKTRAMMILTPGLAMWPLLFAHLAALGVEGLVLSILRRDLTLWREIYRPALTEPCREWAALRARRSEVQAERTISVTGWFSVVRWQLRKVAMLARYGIPKVQ
ncbi:glycosyltransferase [Rhodanobacter denitrificans]|uniref:glycosyltransferase family 2 protein n=1 Tax=Rhodanobacter denitrificans TaxID=666685 RepID=UPI000260E674|nr:glycosyltransferase [Rhodanobacter denitrificans]EIL99424.1 glycosyl transferase family protein [Rhodanobacter denitrificans]UJM89708.1 glycosyltransferase [Rhodanobacter denitrificans]